MNYMSNRSNIMIATLACAMAGFTTANASEGAGEYIDDATITAKVKSALVVDNDINALTISVETIKGEVQLTGTANSMEESNKATMKARKVTGVKSVINNIKIK